MPSRVAEEVSPTSDRRRLASRLTKLSAGCACVCAAAQSCPQVATVSRSSQYHQLHQEEKFHACVSSFGVLVILAMVLAACAAGAARRGSGGEVKVAVLAPLSGPVPTFGVIDPRWRPAGHRRVERQGRRASARRSCPIVEDSQCTPDPAVNAANKVIDQDKVKLHHRRSLLQGLHPGLRDRQRQEGASRSARPRPTRP